MSRPQDDGATERIPVAGPWVTELEVQYVADAAANDWYGNAGQSVGHVRAGVRRRARRRATPPRCRTAHRRCTSPSWPSASDRATR